MQRMGHIAILLTTISLTAGSLAQAQSRLMGDDYTFSGTNFPGDIGVTEDPEQDRPRPPMDSGTLPAILTFDGIEEVAGGMKVNERVVSWPGQPGGIPVEQASGIDGETEFDLVDWENAGEVVEFSFTTASGGWISSELLDQSFITMKDLNWKNSDPGSEPYFFETGFYMYYSKDGVPATGYETLLPQIGLLVGPHPFDKSVEEVFYIAYSRGQVEDVTLPYEGGVDLTFGTTQLDENNGSWAALADAMDIPEFIGVADGLHIGFLVDPPTGTDVSLPGDFNFDGVLNSLDIDDLTKQSAAGTNPLAYDLNADNRVDDADIKVWVSELFNSWIGDADLDGEFNSGDLVVVLSSGTYETDTDSVWSSGDFNGDARTNSGDLVAALSDGGYELGPRAAVAFVPEPSSLVLVLLGMLMSAIRRRSAR